jgi:transcriptional regulator GlxA family with amidase domain
VRIGFLTFPGFPMACLTSMIEPLRAANEISEQAFFEWTLISEQGAKVVSSAGVVFEADCGLHDKLDVDLLIILSGPTSNFDQPKQANGILRLLNRQGVVLGGVSGGVFPLVRSGVMEGHRVSVHWCYEAAFRAAFPDVDATDDVITRDRRKYTASGAAAAFDLALQLIEERLSGETAHEVACWFQHPVMRGEGVRQRVPAQVGIDTNLPSLVRRAVTLFTDKMSDPISVAEVADTLGVSPRQIERAFKKATNQSPSHYFRDMRMKAAKQLILYSKNNMDEIAYAVGYGTSKPLITHYKRAYGITPQEDRARINAFRVQENVPLPSI